MPLEQNNYTPDEKFEKKEVFKEKPLISELTAQERAKTQLFLEQLRQEREDKYKTLFEKYFPKTEKITWRQDVFVERLYFAHHDWKIELSDIDGILEYAYKVAFKKELNTPLWKEWFQNLRKYESIWKNIFERGLWDVVESKEARENLFLLCWVESNCLPKKKLNSYWAWWYFQILYGMARKYWAEKKSDLNDFEKSANIAARYIKDLIEKIKQEHPNFSERKVIERVITRYNWNFSDRLSKRHKENITKTIYGIFKELNFIRSKKDWSVAKKIEKLKEVEQKFFIRPRDRRWSQKWSHHFGILDKVKRGEVTSENITNWITRYIKTILMQQNKYARQYFAAIKFYEENK